MIAQPGAGPRGVAGRTILNGAGAPAAELGAVGDFYLDTTATELYGPKDADTGWGSGVALKGADGAAGGGGGGFPPLNDLTGMATLVADQTKAFWMTFDGSATVTFFDGTNTIVGTVANGTSDTTHIDVGSGRNNANETIIQAVVVWLVKNYIAGNTDVKPMFQTFYPDIVMGMSAIKTGETLGITHRDGTESIEDITLTLSEGADAALVFTQPV